VYEQVPEGIKENYDILSLSAIKKNEPTVENALNIAKLTERACELLLNMSEHQAGTFAIPEPTHVKEDASKPASPPPIMSEKQRNDKLREEKLGALLMKEIEEDEKNWTNIDPHIPLIKIELADSILDQINMEIAKILNDVGEKRKRASTVPI
jgi:hypothetical protein